MRLGGKVMRVLTGHSKGADSYRFCAALWRCFVWPMPGWAGDVQVGADMMYSGSGRAARRNGFGVMIRRPWGGPARFHRKKLDAVLPEAPIIAKLARQPKPLYVTAIDGRGCWALPFGRLGRPSRVETDQINPAVGFRRSCGLGARYPPKARWQSFICRPCDDAERAAQGGAGRDYELPGRAGSLSLIMIVERAVIGALLFWLNGFQSGTAVTDAD